MSKYIARIPRSTIRRMALITGGGRSLEQVKAAEAPDLICNGGFFAAIGEPTHHLKADGVVRATAPWTSWGYAWDEGSDVSMVVLPADDKRSYIAAYELITPYQTPDKPLAYSMDLAWDRGRTAMGLSGDDLVLLCCRDKSVDAMTPEDLREAMLAEGCESALMLDGGGSSQCDFGVGQVVDSSRPVDNYICIWLTEEAKNDKDKEESPVDEIKEEIMTKNRCHTNFCNGVAIIPQGIMVHSSDPGEPWP